MSGVLSAIGSIFKGPKLPKVPSMPDPNSIVSKLAARKKIEARSKDGRAGTIYSGAYTGSNLGGTGN